MATNVFKKISARKVAPLLLHYDIDGLGPQRCPEELFRARRGFEQCKLKFLTTAVDNWDGQTTRTVTSAQNSLALNQNASAQNSLALNQNTSIGQKKKPRKFRPRKMLRKLVGNRENKVQSASV
ncbi:hypothetical protein KP79_PYT20431 [Mizuhopecten yessoensis]|uniref:Uncharacterized protein n=1 Tax=Mizuhopecten yessoensis TaxID=6573 RepID=A0A210PIU1_MIZYE|nr:hypothetical protein KP79_PYT20431 [Mizuhopecten yessoensis]